MPVGTVYFERPGPENTDKTLELALKRARELGIKHVVVASTTGETGVKAAEVMCREGLRVIVVTHQYGFRKPGENPAVEERLRRIRELGGEVLTATDLLTTVPKPFGGLQGGFPLSVVAQTLRMFCEGMKVCVEITLMAADAGRIPVDKEVVAVAGTGRGADTAVIPDCLMTSSTSPATWAAVAGSIQVSLSRASMIFCLFHPSRV